MPGLAIDCHGHFTTEPPEFEAFRSAQLAFADRRGKRLPTAPTVGDSALAQIVSENQLRLQQERGLDFTLLSPRASAMGHHVANLDLALGWARFSNDTVLRIAQLFPRNFAAVCQLPQTVMGGIEPLVNELRRCVEAGAVGCNINPDPSGGRWVTRPLHDPWWDPLWEAMIELSVPGMIHASASCDPAVHTTGAHYIAADTIAFMQLVEGDLFERYEALMLVIPHGGGAAPFHWGRYRGLALMLGKPPLDLHVMRNVSFDTCVYHQAGIDLLVRIVDPGSLLFGSEQLGAVRGPDPETGQEFDDTKRYIDAADLEEHARHKILEGNARRVYPRLDALLSGQGR
ncbi:amidohydrolase family protein [Herbiconiux daphne]|uniref:Amidohydrolase n=1 Tax=Herbiconiux daphne TaxID=2970914 RepID=A0ABT2H6Y5_9MICO|nr:amidohydrolase family protein [Herbiconiux daphne]MCS5735721.1 amidohydrolase [Herbiconiux daphne]